MLCPLHPYAHGLLAHAAGILYQLANCTRSPPLRMWTLSAHALMRASGCSAETRGEFERQLKAIVDGDKTLQQVLTEDGAKYKQAFESAVQQANVRFVKSLLLLHLIGASHASSSAV